MNSSYLPVPWAHTYPERATIAPSSLGRLPLNVYTAHSATTVAFQIHLASAQQRYEHCGHYLAPALSSQLRVNELWSMYVSTRSKQSSSNLYKRVSVQTAVQYRYLSSYRPSHPPQRVQGNVATFLKIAPYIMMWRWRQS